MVRSTCVAVGVVAAPTRVISGHAEDAMGRRWGTQLIVIAFLAGLLLYGFFCYRVLTVGHQHQANLLQSRDRI
jgi:hypothetical protein